MSVGLGFDMYIPNSFEISSFSIIFVLRQAFMRPRKTGIDGIGMADINGLCMCFVLFCIFLFV